MPDFFELPIEGTTLKKWVILIAPANGFPLVVTEFRDSLDRSMGPYLQQTQLMQLLYGLIMGAILKVP